MNKEKEEQLKTIASRVRKNQDITKEMLTCANYKYDVDTMVNLILDEEKN